MHNSDFIKIKEITCDHIEDVYILESLCFDTPWTKEQFQKALDDPIYQLLGAFEITQEANNLAQEILRAYLLVTQIADYAEIINIASHPDYRRKGLAKALLNSFFKKECIQEKSILKSKKNNFHSQENKQTQDILHASPLINHTEQIFETILEVRAKNLAAQALYKIFGFKPIHTRKNYYPDDDAIVMQRKN